MAEIRRAHTAAKLFLLMALSAVLAGRCAHAGEPLVWRKAAWRFHPPEGYSAAEKPGHGEFILLANGQTAFVGRLASSGDGFIQLQDEEGRWLWTTLLPGGAPGFLSDQIVAAVRSSSTAWDLVVSDDGSHTLWRLDDRGQPLWRRRVREDLDLAWVRAVAAEGDGVWLGGWVPAGDVDCGDGASVVKLDPLGNVVWRWRDLPERFNAVADLVPLGDGRLLVVLIDDLGCKPIIESTLALLNADGQEIARYKLPFAYTSRRGVRLADGRVAFLVPRADRSEFNRLFIASIDEFTSVISIAEVALDDSLATEDGFYSLPATAGSDGGLVFFVGYALQWLLPAGRIAHTVGVPPEDWRPCQIEPSKVLCVDPYLIRWIEFPSAGAE